MRKKQNNGGFTLVEFVITIAIASMITLAATTMLLLGLRIHHKTSTLTAQQNAISMLYTAMDTIASEEAAEEIEVDVTAEKTSVTAGGTVIEYNAGEKTVYLNGTAFASNIDGFHAKKENNLLTIQITTEQNHEYNFSVYCRKEVEPSE